MIFVSGQAKPHLENHVGIFNWLFIILTKIDTESIVLYLHVI